YEAGVKRMIPFNVSGPFHTAQLLPASKKLAQDLAKLNFQTKQIPVISNTTAEIMPQEAIQALLGKQIMSAVRFEDSIET
ncbi:malonyl CoA-acyl carrier protein transacylase, partial [Enterococcus faecalis]